MAQAYSTRKRGEVVPIDIRSEITKLLLNHIEVRVIAYRTGTSIGLVSKYRAQLIGMGKIDGRLRYQTRCGEVSEGPKIKTERLWNGRPEKLVIRHTKAVDPPNKPLPGSMMAPLPLKRLMAGR